MDIEKVVPTDKKCENSCPNCGAGIDDIDWLKLENDSPPYQKAVCNICGCNFHEVYEYSHTFFNMGEVDRIECPYPMSKFYTYMDEVVDDDRVSTTEDCEKCDEENCENSHCLISGPHEDKFPPKKKENTND